MVLWASSEASSTEEAEAALTSHQVLLSLGIAAQIEPRPTKTMKFCVKQSTLLNLCTRDAEVIDFLPWGLLDLAIGYMCNPRMNEGKSLCLLWAGRRTRQPYEYGRTQHSGPPRSRIAQPPFLTLPVPTPSP